LSQLVSVFNDFPLTFPFSSHLNCGFCFLFLDHDKEHWFSVEVSILNFLLEHCFDRSTVSLSIWADFVCGAMYNSGLFLSCKQLYPGY